MKSLELKQQRSEVLTVDLSISNFDLGGLFACIDNPHCETKRKKETLNITMNLPPSNRYSWDSSDWLSLSSSSQLDKVLDRGTMNDENIDFSFETICDFPLSVYPPSTNNELPYTNHSAHNSHSYKFPFLKLKGLVFGGRGDIGCFLLVVYSFTNTFQKDFRA